MIWSSLPEFIDMGGYALYVWGAYTMTAVALAWEALMLVQRRRRALDEARAWREIHAEETDHEPAP